MSSAALAWRLETHATLRSTNDLCRARAEAGEPEGLAVRAEAQSAGRGTQGRAWVSPPGNLYLSVLLRPVVDIRVSGQFALLAGIAAVEALAPFAAAPLALKWPNDVLLGRAKLAGVLVESAGGAEGIDWLVIGIGANLATAPRLADRTTAHLAGALAPAAAAEAILARLAHWERTRRASGFGPIRAAWQRHGGATLGPDGQLLAA